MTCKLCVAWTHSKEYIIIIILQCIYEKIIVNSLYGMSL